MIKILNILELSLLLVMLMSCNRRPLYEYFIEEAKIPISINWEDAFENTENNLENLYNASVWLYAKEGAPFYGKSYKEYSLSSAHEGNITVPIGEYRVIIFNMSVSNFGSTVGFRGMESYDTFEYYANTYPSRSSSRPNYILEPEHLAIWRHDDLKVTVDMLTVSRSKSEPITEMQRLKAELDLKQLMSVKPKKVTSSISVQVSVQNIASAKSAQGELSGMSNSISLWSGKRSKNSSIHIFPFSPSGVSTGTWGSIKSEFISIGPPDDEDIDYSLSVRFQLTEEYEGSTYFPAADQDPFSFNINKYIGSGNIDVSIVLGNSDEEFPNLPEFETDGGFQPSVGDWGDEEDLELK